MLIQYHGNDMERLRDAAAELLCADPLPPLVAESFIVPNLGMARWLRHGVAARLGIAANLRCDLPRAFMDRLAAQLLDASDARVHQAYAKEALALRLMRIVPQQLAQKDFAPVRDYLAGHAEPRRLLALSRRLAALFDQYLLYRPDWLLDWERGGSAGIDDVRNAWQAPLWRILVADIREAYPDARHGATRMQGLLDRLGGGDPAPLSLPSRVIGFGLGAMPPMLVGLLQALSARTDVQLFQFNPCREYWGDIVNEKVRARWTLLSPQRAVLAQSRNPLLESLGSLGRDNLELLLEASDGDVEPFFVAPAAQTVLAAIQRDILDLDMPERPRTVCGEDESFCFAEVHSNMREIEVLHDQLLHLLATRKGLRPRDIVVMAPDIALYADAIHAVFEEMRGGPRFIPFTIADRSNAQESTLAHSFMHLLRLPDSRFRASEICALLAVPAIAERFALDDEARSELQQWIRDSGIRWGTGAEDSVLQRNTWRWGLERMLLGVALEEGSVYRGATPLALGGNDAHERIGKLAEFLDRLMHYARELQQARPVNRWIALVDSLLEDLYSPRSEHAAELALLRAAAGTVAEQCELARCEEAIEREVFVELLQARLEMPEASHAFLRGGVNFCQLTPLRCIPFRVVCLLGMNASAFPRAHEPPGFDLMAEARRRGDPSRREDDRYLFLEALIAAREHLYISYAAWDERSNDEREASLPVSQLREYIDRNWLAAPPQQSALEYFTRHHRLKAFHGDYFSADSGLFSFRSEWLPAAQASGKGRQFCIDALPAEPLDTLAARELQTFFRNPCRGFFEARLGVRFVEPDAGIEDCEPFALDSLQQHQMGRALVAGALAGIDPERRLATLRAGGVLPLGAAGEQWLERQRESNALLVQRVATWREYAPRSVEFSLELAGTRVHGVVGGVRATSLRDFHAGKHVSANTLLRFWIAHLLACAAEAVGGDSELHDQQHVHRLPLIDSEEARQELLNLLLIYRDGMQRPLPLFAKSSYAWAASFLKDEDGTAAMRKARASFLPGFNSDGECNEVHVARAFPEPAGALGEAFTRYALRVFQPLLLRLQTEDA